MVCRGKDISKREDIYGGDDSFSKEKGIFKVLVIVVVGRIFYWIYFCVVSIKGML